MRCAPTAQTLAVEPSTWLGSRDRSWGIRPVGDADAPGRTADDAGGGGGFWWLYVPLRFDDFQIIVIVQEKADGYRTLNDAKRVWADGRVEQLGLAGSTTSGTARAAVTRSTPRCTSPTWPGSR